MKQYCRYCAFLSVGDCAYCEKFDNELSDSYCKHINHCKSFEFNDMDAYGENLTGYKERAERKAKKKIDNISLY
jgi:hypothetical protein